MARTTKGHGRANPTRGRRVGTKRRDMRWEVDGVVWDSRFEYEVYSGISQQAGAERVRRTTEEDQLDYTSVVKNAECSECRSDAVVQRRKFTPDLFVVSAPGGSGGGKGGYFIEAKGYIRADRRSLLRHFVKCHPDLDLRFVIERDYRVTRTLTLGQWITKFLKKPWTVWTGKLPEGWT